MKSERELLLEIRDQLERVQRRVNRLPTSEGIMLSFVLFVVVLVLVRACAN